MYIFEHPGCEILSGEIAERLNPRSVFQEKSCRDEGSHSPTEPLIAIDFAGLKFSPMCTLQVRREHYRFERRRRRDTVFYFNVK